MSPLRIFCLLMTVAFLYATIVQYNDPDPYYWMPIYLIPTAISLLIYFGRGNAVKLFLLVLALVYFAGAYYMWPAHWEGVALQHGMKTVNIEEGRESLGLAVVGFTMVIYFLSLSRTKRIIT